MDFQGGNRGPDGRTLQQLLHQQGHRHDLGRILCRSPYTVDAGDVFVDEKQGPLLVGLPRPGGEPV